jgi:hypothetical protein
MSKDSSRCVGVVRAVLACAAGPENTAQCPSTMFDYNACKRDEFEIHVCDEFREGYDRSRKQASKVSHSHSCAALGRCVAIGSSED